MCIRDSLCPIRVYDCLQIICVIINVADILFRTACHFGDSSECIVFVTALTSLILHGYPFPGAIICVGYVLFRGLAFCVLIRFLQQVIQLIVITVSYTHLDVYKRQVSYSIVLLLHNLYNLHDSMHQENFGRRIWHQSLVVWSTLIAPTDFQLQVLLFFYIFSFLPIYLFLRNTI